jgi:hypothetical protein
MTTTAKKEKVTATVKSAGGKPTLHSIGAHLAWNKFHELAGKDDLIAEFVSTRDHPALQASDPLKPESIKTIQEALNLFLRDAKETEIELSGKLDAEATEAAIRKLQEHLVNDPKTVKNAHFDPKKVQVTGKLDQLTFFALDQLAPALKTAADKAAAPAASKAGKTFSDPWEVGPFIFNAFVQSPRKAPRQSMAFGIRMYKALVQWLYYRPVSGNDYGPTSKTPYSTDCTPEQDAHYKDDLKERYSSLDRINQWPALAVTHPFIEWDSERPPAAGQPAEKVYTVFGIDYIGSGFTNCSSSQLAAFFVSLGSRMARVRLPTGERRYAMGTATSGHKVPGLEQHDPALTFNKCVQGSGAPGRFGNWKNFGMGLLGMQFLGVGDAIDTSGGPYATPQPYKGFYTRDPKVLYHVRIGDWANSTGHAWLVGDVRYGLWFDDPDRGQPDKYCDQSSFVDKDGGEVKEWPADGGPPLDVKPLTAPQIKSLQNPETEALLEKRLEDFYERAKKRGQIDGKTVKKMEVVNIACFTANAIWFSSVVRRTIHGKTYILDPNNTNKEWWSEDTHQENEPYRGISNRFAFAGDTKLSFGRFFARAH